MTRLIHIVFVSIMLTAYPNQGIAQSYFTRTDLDYESLNSLYQDVPLHGGTDIEGFVVEINGITNIDPVKATAATDHVVCQPFIDENGEVETIFITKSVNRYVDSLSIDALKKSKFKPLQMAGKLTKYSCIVKYYFSDGFALTSSVNDILTTIPEKPFDALTKTPTIISQVAPEYPVEAIKAGVQARVTVRVLINPNGEVEKVEVVKGHAMLNEAAMEAASKWEFTRGEYKGIPVKVWMNIPIDFRLRRK